MGLIQTEKKGVKMLILNREISQKVMIGKDMFVTVLGVIGTKVILGFQVPKEITVDREEVYLKKLINKSK